jgi:hypothetical protein
MSSRFVLSPFNAELPSSNFPALQQDAQHRPYLAFDASVAETCYWTFIAPQGLTGTKTAIIHYRAASATTGTYQPDVALEAITPGDAVDTDAASSFATANTPTADTVPGTAGYEKTVSVTLTNDDSIAPGDYARLSLSRNMADTAAGDIHVFAVELRDAA